jgi:methionine--tRNA ligase beta chain
VITCLDIRVGEISNVKPHPAAEKLYVEDIAIGGGVSRTVCSGLQEYMTAEELAGPCLVVCNMKPRKMQGIESQAMVLAAQSADGKTVHLLQPPAGSAVGDAISFEDIAEGTAATPNQLNKGAGKKALEAILSCGDLKTNGGCEATWRGHTMTTAKGVVKAASLADCKIK